MDYPSHEVYATLYARYLNPARTQQLLALAGDLRGKSVLDLCGGGGRLAQLAAKAGARVTLVDESAAMAAGGATAGLTVLLRPVEHAFLTVQPADIVFCQQAVNYWLTEGTAWDLAGVVKPGGLFIFNTFNAKPSPVPRTKDYVLGGRHYVEISQLVEGAREDMVEHVQVCEGLCPHVTRFPWISPDQFQRWLRPWFDCEEQVDGATSVWRCVRRATDEAQA